MTTTIPDPNLGYAQFEIDYALLVRKTLDTGVERQTRNAKTTSIFGQTLKVSVEPNQFPILRGRRMFARGILGELAAFLKGPKHIDDFRLQGCNYWDKWAKPDGSIDVDYGNAWLNWNGVNQLQELVDGLKRDPYGRRHIVTGWRPDRLPMLSLPCCHLLYQWYVRDGKLDMMWIQRSVDMMIGLPSDIVLAYAFNLAVANEVGLQPGEITMVLGDTHVYEQHYDGAEEYLKRVLGNEVSNQVPWIGNADPSALPKHPAVLGGLWSFDPDAFALEGYSPQPRIDFELLA